ncbi:hypothetical protein DM475_10785 [Lactobacillus helveticus]|uniref:Uncharacterized protein n=1 Tax=Lactobacillus helveticus TaxID=1587 RepID=A0AAV4E638_LACHE|nr:hypothetical protein HUO_09580 [Lactobacillus helveticus]ANZ56549.1 hypothetical protein BCM45_09205 [Lactobacillus helveticus]AQY52994.1 hypothetical protein BCM44_02045 [Lactobacillus helveticus]MCT3404305.1 hypothetical protein [Lactobacillus helveticus]MCT3406026.1 hypothetical protein [Lactobacillus helveticus]
MNQLTSLTSKCQITLELPNKVADDFQDEVNNLKIIGTDKVGNNICVFDKNICWYGNLDFGGIIKPYMTAMRIWKLSNFLCK